MDFEIQMNGKFTGLSIHMEALEKAKDDKMLKEQIQGISTSFCVTCSRKI